jgi:hypothetical protein
MDETETVDTETIHFERATQFGPLKGAVKVPRATIKHDPFRAAMLVMKAADSQEIYYVEEKRKENS